MDGSKAIQRVENGWRGRVEAFVSAFCNDETALVATVTAYTLAPSNSDGLSELAITREKMDQI